MAPRLRLNPGAVAAALRRALPWLVVAALALGALVGRVLWSSKAELAAGRSAYGRGDRQAAILHLDRAAHWYAPGSPWVVEALEELRQIGRQAEMEGQQELALSAYRAIRRSCLGTRSLYVPHRERLREANRRIAAILARQTPPPMDAAKTISQRQREHLALLERLDQPDPLWSLLAGLGLLLWIGAAFGFVSRALDENLRPLREPATRWGVAFLSGLVLWIVSLLMA